jgi:hypothetical protein
MTQEKADLINALVEIEDRIDELWEFHPDNPHRVDVEDEFHRLQATVVAIQTRIEEIGDDDEDDDLI